MQKDHLADEGVEFSGGGNSFDDIDAFESNYQDSDDTNNPTIVK